MGLPLQAGLWGMVSIPGYQVVARPKPRYYWGCGFTHLARSWRAMRDRRRL